MELINDSLSIIISFLDVRSIQNLERVNNYYKNYIRSRKLFITTNILKNWGWTLEVTETKSSRYISVWSDNFCVSFLPNIIDDNNWDYIVRHIQNHTPMKYSDLIEAASACSIS